MFELISEKEKNELSAYSKIPVGKAVSLESIFESEEKKKDLSIIVPCYKTESFLKQCMDSIINQVTEFDFEVIAVNDGSPDGCLDILMKYADEYKNVIVINQKNGGVSSARNSGVRISTGRYITFIDSDDYISDNYIQSLMKVAYQEDADLVSCGYKTFKDNYIIKKRIPQNNNKILTGCDWGKVYKREFFENIIHPEGFWYEDSILAHLILPRVEKISFTQDCFYYYRSNASGVTISSKKKSKSLDTVYITDLMIRSAYELYGEDYILSKPYFKTLIRQFYLNHKRISKLDVDIQKTVFDIQRRFVEEYYKGFDYDEGKYHKYLVSMRDNRFDKACAIIKFDFVLRLCDLVLRK